MTDSGEQSIGRAQRGYDVLLRAVVCAICDVELDDLRALAYAHYVGGTIEELERAIAARRKQLRVQRSARE